jgi:hypothetical protein
MKGPVTPAACRREKKRGHWYLERRVGSCGVLTWLTTKHPPWGVKGSGAPVRRFGERIAEGMNFAVVVGFYSQLKADAKPHGQNDVNRHASGGSRWVLSPAEGRCQTTGYAFRTCGWRMCRSSRPSHYSAHLLPSSFPSSTTSHHSPDVGAPRTLPTVPNLHLVGETLSPPAWVDRRPLSSLTPRCHIGFRHTRVGPVEFPS